MYEIPKYDLCQLQAPHYYYLQYNSVSYLSMLDCPESMFISD